MSTSNTNYGQSHLCLKFVMVLMVIVSSTLLGRAQTRTVTGVVTDKETKEPLLGATVYVSGSTNGVMTDMSGSYSITVSDTETLIFDMIGYEPISLLVGKNTVINAEMESEDITLDDAIVIGYGTVKKRDLTGSVGSLSSKQLQQVTVTNPQLALQGRVAGVQVTQTDFSPSGGLNIRVRGTRSFNASNDPLYVVDGVILSTGLSFINPGDIESIDILKDASATAIYGSRGANGVVIVTTKRGKEGRAQIEYTSHVGIQQIGRKLDLMDANEWIEYMREAHRQASGSSLKYNSASASYTEDMKMTRFNQDPYLLRQIQSGWNEDGTIWDGSKVQGFDWLGHVTKTGVTQNHNISVRGGSDKVKYSFGASYSGTDGVVKNRTFERINARSTVDAQITKHIKAGMTFQYSHSLENLDNGLYSTASQMWPAAVPYDDEEKLIQFPGGDTSSFNVLYDMIDGSVVNQRDRDRLLSNAYIELKLFDGLSFRSTVSYDYDLIMDGDYRASMTRSNVGGDNTASVEHRKTYGISFDNVLTYSKEFNKTHALTATLVQSSQETTMEYAYVSAKQIPLNTQLWYSMGAAGEITKATSGYTRRRLASFLGRVNYSLLDRYLLTASMRYDGASVLAEGNK